MSQDHIVPTVAPVDGNPGLLRLARLWSSNALSCLPKQVYEQPLTSWRLLGNRLVFVTDPEALRTVLVDAVEDYPKSPMEQRALSRVLGDSVFTIHGPEWKSQRAMIAPHFSRSLMLRQVSNIVAEIRCALDEFAPDGENSLVYAHRFAQRPTSRVVKNILFGNRLSSEADTLLETTADHLMQSRWDVVYGLLKIPSWMPCPGGTENARAVQKFQRMIRLCLQQRGSCNDEDSSVAGTFAAAIGADGGRRMNERQTIDNMMALFFPGFETVAISLAWTIYLLAIHQTWQDRIAAEVKHVCGSGPVEARHIEQLVVARSVFREAMRLYPPVPLLTRKATLDDRLCGHQIVEGTNVVLPIYAIHRHQTHWDAPNSFRPERFMTSKRRVTGDAYLPFGAGPRTCPGAQLGMIEATVALATLAQHVRFRPVENYVPKPVARILLRPVDGMPVHFDRR